VEFLQKYKAFLIVLLTLIFAGVGFYLSRTLNKQADALTREISTKQGTLEGYYSNSENAPSPYMVNRLTRDKLTLEGNYEAVSSRYALLPVLTLPEGEIFPSLYYKETMYLVLDDLSRQAESKGITLTSSLGVVETGLPPAEQVPALLVTLDTVKRLCEEVFRSKISSLDSVQVGALSVSPFYIEVPLAITVSGSSSRIAYFFETLGSSQTIFVLGEMSMSSSGGGKFQASLSLKRILWGKDLVDKIKITALPSASSASGTGGPQSRRQQEVAAPTPPPAMPQAPRDLRGPAAEE
jgi:hypothetical protein